MADEVIGGVLIGSAAAILWIGIGRISGMTGVTSSLFLLYERQRHWALWFVLGLTLAWPMMQFAGLDTQIRITDNTGLLIAAGLLVGFGTYVSNGCTSGHGVCGMGRLSVRSLVATITFMAAGIVTVAVMNAMGVSL